MMVPGRLNCISRVEIVGRNCGGLVAAPAIISWRTGIMSHGQFHVVVRHLRRLVGEGAPQATDRELLQRFVAERDEDAFASLVERHGSMVWGVCRRALRHAQDAEDVFQATFLVLARKAAAVRWRE